MKESQATRDRLIDAFYRMAIRKGFDRTSVNDVLEVAGVKKGSFYYHFADKESLGLAVLERDQADFYAMIDACLDAPTPLEGIRRFLAKALQKHRQNGFVGGCLWGNTALEMSDSNAQYATLVHQTFIVWGAKIEKAVREGQKCGQIRRDLSSESLAQWIVASIEGGIMLSRLAKNPGPLNNCIKTMKIMLLPGEASPTGGKNKGKKTT